MHLTSYKLRLLSIKWVILFFVDPERVNKRVACKRARERGVFCDMCQHACDSNLGNYHDYYYWKTAEA